MRPVDTDTQGTQSSYLKLVESVFTTPTSTVQLVVLAELQRQEANSETRLWVRTVPYCS